MPECGSQAVLCDLPIRFDTYRGCAHGCRYCFAQRKIDIKDIRTNETQIALESFIKGERNAVTNWCDWNIPLHWGGLSDPFQPIEKERRASHRCLQLLAESGYPFVVSTKGALIGNEEYLALLEKCNAVVQISMVCDRYDQLEQGAPGFEERLRILERVSPRVTRTIVRIQPYMTEVLDDVLCNLPRFRAAGAYGIVVEGMKFARKKPNLVKVGADLVYPVEQLKRHFESIHDAAHRAGLRFFCGENRLRTLGDDMTCCGTEGLEGFKPNRFNLCRLLNGEKVDGTDRMKEIGTAGCFKAIHQDAGFSRVLKKNSFQTMMLREYHTNADYYRKMFNVGAFK